MDYKGMVHDCVFRAKSFQAMRDGEGYVHEMQCKKAIEELISRLENTERERDTAVKHLHGNCFACAHYSGFHQKGKCKNCCWDNANPACLREYQEDNWEWKRIGSEK